MTPSADSTDAGLPGSAVLPAGLIADGEQIILALKPGGWFILLVSLPAWAVIGAAALALSLAGRTFPSIPREHLPVLAMAAALVRVAVAISQWLARLYVLTDRRVIRVKGVLHVRVFEAPLTRIQNTYLSMSLPERILGLGTILFATAGTASAEAAWWLVARPREVHAIIVETIRRAQTGRNGEKP